MKSVGQKNELSESQSCRFRKYGSGLDMPYDCSGWCRGSCHLLSESNARNPRTFRKRPSGSQLKGNRLAVCQPIGRISRRQRRSRLRLGHPGTGRICGEARGHPLRPEGNAYQLPSADYNHYENVDFKCLGICGETRLCTIIDCVEAPLTFKAYCSNNGGVHEGHMQQNSERRQIPGAVA